MNADQAKEIILMLHRNSNQIVALTIIIILLWLVSFVVRK
jgi:hypothetical protein